MSSKSIEFDGVVTSVGSTLFGTTFERLVTVLTGTFAPWERMLMLPVPAGTVKLTTSPTAWTPRVVAWNTGVPTWAACAGSHAVVGCGAVNGCPSTTFGGPVGGSEHADEPVGERHAPSTQAVSGALQFPGPLHEGKQNEPVEVLTHLPFAGQVVWSVGLHAAVQAPPGNSGFGSPAQISPDAVLHPAPQAFPRSALAGRCCGGQFAAGTQAPNPGQQV